MFINTLVFLIVSNLLFTALVTFLAVIEKDFGKGNINFYAKIFSYLVLAAPLLITTLLTYYAFNLIFR